MKDLKYYIKNIIDEIEEKSNVLKNETDEENLSRLEEEFYIEIWNIEIWKHEIVKFISKPDLDSEDLREIYLLLRTGFKKRNKQYDHLMTW